MIGADAALTRQAWREFGERPFILAFNPLKLGELGDPRYRGGHGRICPFPAEQIVGHLCYDIPNHEALIEVTGDLGRIRKQLGLARGAPLRTAVAGTHSSMSRLLRLGWASSSLENIVLQACIQERKLSCVVGAALERMGEFELVRLPANVDLEPRAPEYDGLVASIRGELAEARGPRLAGRAPETYLKLPVAVRLYARHPPDGEWIPLAAPVPQYDLGSEAEWLSQRFLEYRLECAEQGLGDPEGVLVKVLGPDLDRHTLADTPIVSPQQCRAAAAAGIRAILLDARCGIVVGDSDGRGSRPSVPVRVYGV